MGISWNGSAPPPSTPGGLYFMNFQGLVTYFEQLAQRDALVIPAHGVDCTPSGVDAGACFYNPLLPQLDASDIHYSTPDEGFVGPDGDPYVVVHLVDMNVFFVVNADLACATYQLGLEYNHCRLSGPQTVDAAAD
jgi:hypothetical protein